ncbi:MAG: DarT ssDNA thymidine ADP-ribosyltransferase family protein [Legionellales bacterium]|nr:DarT ssDNA thymidine ADP-ribosyltransferase family protein [Legionellales bacterium]
MEALQESRTIKSDQIDSLYYIVDTRNLLSILEKGILAHDTAQKTGVYSKQHDISDQGVQRVRRDKNFFSPRSKIKRKLHTYANMYIQPHNAMMVVVQREISREHLCVLRIDGKILRDRQSEVVITTKNAACHRARFFAPKDWAPSPFTARALTSSLLSGLPSKKWAGRAAFQSSKQSRQSEVLFPEKIEPGYINGVYVHNDEIKNRVCAMIQSQMPDSYTQPDVMVHPSLFVSPKRGAFGKTLSIIEDVTNPCRLSEHLDEELTIKVKASQVSDVEPEPKRTRMGHSS